MILKFSDYDEIHTMTPKEVAEQLVNCGAIDLDENESICNVSLECGTDLEITIVDEDTNEDYTATFTLEDIRSEFTECEYYCWAKDENGNDVLACFNI